MHVVYASNDDDGTCDPYGLHPDFLEFWSFPKIGTWAARVRCHSFTA